MAEATIKFVEGFASALNDDNQLVVAFRDIPEGVTVTPSMMGTGTATEVTDPDATPPVISGDLAPLTLITEGEMSGLDEDGNVALSVARAGQIVYDFDNENRRILPMTLPTCSRGRTPDRKQRNGMS